MNFTDKLIVQPGTKIHLDQYDPAETFGYKHNARTEGKLDKSIKRLDDLQYLLYAEHKRALLVVLQAMDAGGKTRNIATFSDGPNPVVPIPKTAGRSGKPAPGLYLTDDSKQVVYFAPASQLARYAGDVLVGTETKAQFWIVEPHGNGFVKVRVRHNLRGGKYSLEAAIFVP